jgi:hypothetical protein
MPFLPGWSYRTKIIVTEGSGITLFNHQVGMISLQGNDSEAPNYIDFSMFQSDGADLRITKSDGITVIPHWHWDWNSIAKTANLYFKVDIIIAYSNTDFFLYGGNSGASSISSYSSTMTKVSDDIDGGIAVWHLDEGQPSQVIDSSGNGQDSTINDLLYRGSDGGGFQGDETYNFSGDCAEFDSSIPGVKQAIVPYDSIWDSVGPAITIGFMCYFTTTGSNEVVIFKGFGSFRFTEFEVSRASNGKIKVRWGNIVSTFVDRFSNSTLSTDTWYHVIVTRSSNHMYIYIDSVLDLDNIFQGGAVPNIGNNSVRIGNHVGATEPNAEFKDGFIDDLFVLDRLVEQEEVDSLFSRRKHVSVQPVWVITELGSYYHDTDFDIPTVLELEEFSHETNFDAFSSNPNESLEGDYYHDLNFNQFVVIGKFDHDSGFDAFAYNPNESMAGNYDHDSNFDEIDIFGEYAHDTNINPFTTNPNESLAGNYDHDVNLSIITVPWEVEGVFDHDSNFDEFIYFPIESDIIIQVNSKFTDSFSVNSKFLDLVEVNSKITDSFKVESEII